MDYMGPVAVGKSMGSTLTGVLEKEDPGTIEQLFRFISRPAYAFRSLITGDLEGTIRNTLQFMNEIPTGGMVDPDLTVTSMVDGFFEALGMDPELPADLTSKNQRPEMSDVIYRWGGPHPASLGWGSRMAIDVLAGALTDPTNLISGGGKGVAQGALTGATRSMGQDLAVAGLRASKLGNEALEATMHLPGPLGLGGLNAPRTISPERLAPMVRGLEGKAAEKLLFQNIDPSTGLLKKWSTNIFDGSLADGDAVAGNFVRGELPLLVTDRNLPGRLIANNPEVNAQLARGIAAQEILQGELPVIGNNMGGSTVYFTPRSEWRFNRLSRLMSQGPLDSTPVAQMAHERDLLRLRGMNEEGIARHLGQQWPDLGMDGTVARLLAEDAQWGRLGAEVPGETLDAGIRALRDKYGMEDPAALYASFLGRRGKAIPNFWSNAASLTVPGMAYNMAPAAVKETIQGWTTGVRRLFNKFSPGDLPPAVQKVMRVLSGQQRANNIRHNDVAGSAFFGQFDDVELEELAKGLDRWGENNHHELRAAAARRNTPGVPPARMGTNELSVGLDRDAAAGAGGLVGARASAVLNQIEATRAPFARSAYNAETSIGNLQDQMGALDPQMQDLAAQQNLAMDERQALQEGLFDRINALEDQPAPLNQEQVDDLFENGDLLPPEALEVGNGEGVGRLEHTQALRRYVEINSFLGESTGDFVSGMNRAEDVANRLEDTMSPADVARVNALVRTGQGFQYRGWSSDEAQDTARNLYDSLTWAEREIALRQRWLEEYKTLTESLKAMPRNPQVDAIIRDAGLLRGRREAEGRLGDRVAAVHQEWARLDTALEHATMGFNEAQHAFDQASLLSPEQEARLISAGSQKAMIDEVGAIIATKRGVPPEQVRPLVEQTYATFQKGMSEIPPAMAFRLKEEGNTLWSHAAEDPFYLPHQAEERIWELLNEGALDRTAARDIRDVFARRRTYANSSAFQSALRGLADQYHIPINNLDELQKWNLGELYLRRMHAFERTKFRAQAMEYGERMAAAHDIPSRRFAQYVRGLFAPAGTRTGTVEKLLGGGTFEIRRPTEGSALHRLLGNGDPHNPLLKITEGTNAAGQPIWRMQWAGLNRIYKPLLTSFPTNPKFHFRNAMSAVVMGAMDPDIGWSGARQTWDLVRNGAIVRKLLKLDYTPDEVTEAVRFLTDPDPVVRHGALSRLRDSGRMVGNYTWDETARILHRSLGGRNLGQADMLSKLDDGFMQGYRLTEEAAGGNPQIANGALRWFQNLVDLGQNMANQVEHRFRTAATLELLSKGVPANEVVERVQKAFVDYDLNSSTERWIRDVFPFAKFMIGSSNWLKPMIERPQMLTALARARASGSRSLENEPGGGAFLPERAEGSVALPLPWRDKDGNLQFLIGLGLPQESALAMVNAATSTEGFRKTVGGALHPVIRLPVEKALGRSFFFDEPWGSYRRASPLTRLLPGAKEVPSADGTKRVEVPGAWNEILNASPLAVQENNLNKILDERWGPITKALNVLTGIRTLSVDMKRELRERMAEYLKDKVASGQVGELSVFFNRMNPEDTPEDLKVVLREFAAQRGKK